MVNSMFRGLIVVLDGFIMGWMRMSGCFVGEGLVRLLEFIFCVAEFLFGLMV